MEILKPENILLNMSFASKEEAIEAAGYRPGPAATC